VRLVKLLLLVASVTFSLPSFSADYQKGLDAYNRGDYEAAVRELRPLAEQGDADAQYYFANLYRKSLGVAQSDTEAVKWYRKSAEQGLARAQNHLGLMYKNGRGVTQSDTEAVKWLRKSAEQGNAAAQSNLGWMYEAGRGVAQSDTEAVKWYRLSAEQGRASGQNNLGFMYKNGRGVTQSDTEAVKWFRLSAEQGRASGQSNLGFMYEKGRGVAQSDTEAWKWYRKAAEQGHAYAQNRLKEMGPPPLPTPQIATTEPKPVESTNQMNADDSERVKELEKRLALLEAQTKQTEQAIASDTQTPSIRITASNSDGARGTISGVATDNTGIAEIRIDNETVSFDESGEFLFSTFIPPGGKDLEIVAYDLKGLSTTETVRLEREFANRIAKISFDRLNPTTRQVRSNNNAIALIVGVAEYSKTAPAKFADKDAQVFYDYANLKLGIPQDRIQTLINDKADEVGLLSGINKWLKRSVKQGESDVYIFFAGHGLASDDGDTAYLIPHDGAPDFLERTAISRDEVFTEVSSVNPRSVTVFLDTCYSGDTRGETRLIAGRPLNIKLQEQTLPKGFTVLTAAGGDQIAKPLKEAQHGLFSYFLMKGMEGGADSNSDNQITARELHTYVRENVVQQSGGSQVPELQGDAERVLVRFR
jgi:TPR repeat protein